MKNGVVLAGDADRFAQPGRVADLDDGVRGHRLQALPFLVLGVLVSGAITALVSPAALAAGA